MDRTIRFEYAEGLIGMKVSLRHLCMTGHHWSVQIKGGHGGWS